MKILDLSRVLAGPLCCQLLADLGAEVTKIEAPGGDETRGWGPPFVNGVSSYYRSCNRGKSLMTLDLKQPDQREQLYVLVKDADVLVENFLPASAKRLGVDPETLWQVNPRLVIGSISAYGAMAPDKPGYDFLMQAQSGLMSITGEAGGDPMKVGVATVDVVTALYLANGIQAALLRRVTTGRGDHVVASLLHCAVASQVNVVQSYLDTGIVPKRRGNAHAQIVPYQLFATADGWVVLAIGNDQQWERFCEAVGESDWVRTFPTNESRVRNREQVVVGVARKIKEKATDHWLQLCEEQRIPASAVWDYEELFGRYGDHLRFSLPDPMGRVSDFLRPPLMFRFGGGPSVKTPPLGGGNSGSGGVGAC